MNKENEEKIDKKIDELTALCEENDVALIISAAIDNGESIRVTGSISQVKGGVDLPMMLGAVLNEYMKTESGKKFNDFERLMLASKLSKMRRGEKR